MPQSVRRIATAVHTENPISMQMGFKISAPLVATAPMCCPQFFNTDRSSFLVNFFVLPWVEAFASTVICHQNSHRGQNAVAQIEASLLHLSTLPTQFEGHGCFHPLSAGCMLFHFETAFVSPSVPIIESIWAVPSPSTGHTLAEQTNPFQDANIY